MSMRITGTVWSCLIIRSKKDNTPIHTHTHTHVGEPHQSVFDFYFQASMWACVMNAVESRLEEKKQLELRVECADAGLRENKRQINTVLNDPARDIRFSLYSGSCQNEGMNEGSLLPNTPPTHPKKAKIKRSFLCV